MLIRSHYIAEVLNERMANYSIEKRDCFHLKSLSISLIVRLIITLLQKVHQNDDV